MQQESGYNNDSSDRTEEFLRLLNRYERALNAYILSLSPDWSVAEDIAQDTRLRLWQQFSKYQPGTDFFAWARSIAYYQVLTYRARSNRDRLRFGPAFYEAVSAAVASQPELFLVRQEALNRCLEKLDTAKRALIENYYSGEQTLREFAEQQGRSYDAVRKAVYRIQLALADCIQTELHKKESQK